MNWFFFDDACSELMLCFDLYTRVKVDDLFSIWPLRQFDCLASPSRLAIEVAKYLSHEDGGILLHVLLNNTKSKLLGFLTTSVPLFILQKNKKI